MLDQIIGCGQRRGNKYFLVRFKGQDNNEIIDWEMAKQYSNEFMEFFGSRTVWTEMKNIIVPDMYDNLQESSDEEIQADVRLNRPSTSQPSSSQLDTCPNEIEFEK